MMRAFLLWGHICRWLADEIVFFKDCRTLRRELDQWGSQNG